MRQKTAKIVLLASGILLLALAVVPHHHHQSGNPVCFAVSCCEETEAVEQDHHDHTAGESHDHCADQCKLTQLYLPGARGGDHVCQAESHDHSGSLHLYIELFLTRSSVSDIHSLQSRTRVRTIPFVEPVQSQYAGTVRALRAPPVYIA